MTNDENRELDAAVAEEVMGYKWREANNYGDKEPMKILLPLDSDFVAGTSPAKTETPRFFDWGRDVPHYSTEIADAWEIVEAMLQGPSIDAYAADRFLSIMDSNEENENDVFINRRWHGTSEEVAEAICRAALEAVRPEEPREA